MREFFAYVKAERDEILASHGDALEFCRDLLTDHGVESLPENVGDLFDNANADERHYAIASAYALLIGRERRRELSAYFTPPVLAHAVLDVCGPILDRCKEPTVLDPACGGGSFLTPIARHLIAKARKGGMSVDHACRSVLKRVRGLEIDPGLAALSQSLLRNALANEYGFTARAPLRLVRCTDALRARFADGFDLIVGNPPYSKVGTARVSSDMKSAGRAYIGGHTNSYALFLLKSLNWLKPGGTLVFVLPTSFVAGPYFAGLRQEILRRAEVLRIDLHEQRENLFLGATQDVCLLSLRRRHLDVEKSIDAEHNYQLGVINAQGAWRGAGTALAKAAGEPWTLPAAHEIKVLVSRENKSLKATAFTLADFGYTVRVGRVVPTRERDQLHTKRRKGDYPLLWASAIRPDASFDFDASARMGNAQWYAPAHRPVSYNTIRPAVLVQRTSNRDQPRRLNAAAVPKSFRRKHSKGFVAENHVIVLESRTTKPILGITKMAALLNAAIVNERFQTVCGSFNVSARLLERLALPDPALVSKLKSKDRAHKLRVLFAALPDVLAPPPLQGSRNAQNAINQPGHLTSGGPIDQHPRLKRRAVA